jgi:hypothetical protein
MALVDGDTSSTEDGEDVTPSTGCGEGELGLFVKQRLGLAYQSGQSEAAARLPLQVAQGLGGQVWVSWPRSLSALRVQVVVNGELSIIGEDVEVDGEVVDHRLVAGDWAVSLIWRERRVDGAGGVEERLWMRRWTPDGGVIDVAPVQIGVVERGAQWTAFVVEMEGLSGVVVATLEVTPTATATPGRLAYWVVSERGVWAQAELNGVEESLEGAWEVRRLEGASMGDRGWVLAWEVVRGSDRSEVWMGAFDPAQAQALVSAEALGMSYQGYVTGGLTLRWSARTQQVMLALSDTASRLSSVYWARWAPDLVSGQGGGGAVVAQQGAGIFTDASVGMTEDAQGLVYLTWSDSRDHRQSDGDYYAAREVYAAALHSDDGRFVEPLAQPFHASPPDHRLTDATSDQDARYPVALSITRAGAQRQGVVWMEGAEVWYGEGHFLCAPTALDWGDRPSFIHQ